MLAEILADVDNCNKIIRTQQGDGKIKTLSINLNSLAAKADLLFNFVGRWYYLKGLALGNSITINLNGEPITIQVSANNFIYKYAESITALDFNGADVVSVNFADCDKLESVTSCDDMFKNCAELLSVDFGGKKLAAVTSATDMFSGCAQLTTLVCPQTSTWKPDISFADCPDLTIESVYSLIGFLYDYDSGVHTINFNSTMWNAVDADTQNDIIAKAGAKGWTIGTAVAYYISGTSAANTVYATINGSAVEIPVTGGTFNYAYYAPITSLSFENDTDVAAIDFSLSDGLAGVTSLADAFKGCSGLTAVDFTACDLSSVATASDAFSGCSSLLNIVLPSNSWQPDVDLSDTAIPYSNMSGIVAGLYTYSSGTHTISFNSTIWDAMSVADQQIVFDAADAKGWTTNAVAVVYKIKGTSSNVNGTETFNIQFILDEQLTPEAAEQITCAVDANGNWSFSYDGKKIYSLYYFCNTANAANTSLTKIDFSDADDLNSVTIMSSAFWRCSNLNSIVFGNNQQINNCASIHRCFANCTSLTNNSIVWGGVTFTSVTSAHNSSNINEAGLFQGCTGLTSVSLPFAFTYLANGGNMFRGCTNLTSVAFPNATFNALTDARYMFGSCTNLTSVSLSDKTFNSVTRTSDMFYNCTHLTSIDLSSATFAALTTASEMFYNCSALTSLDLANKTFGNLQTADFMFAGCNHVTTIDLSTATFGKLNNVAYMFGGCSQMTSLLWNNADLSSIRTVTGGSGGSANGMFKGCSSMTTIPLNNIDWNELTNIGQMFSGCTSWNGYDFSNVQFSKLVRMDMTFSNCRSIISFNFSSATFDKLQRINGAFGGCSSLTNIVWSNSLNLSSLVYIGYGSGSTLITGLFQDCTSLTSFVGWGAQSLSNVTNFGAWFRGCTALTTIDISVAAMSLVDVAQYAFLNCDALTTIDVPQNSTAILPTSTAANAPMDLQHSPLNYQSMLKVANWFSDLTGHTAHTCTFKASAWNALSSAEQNTIDTILSGKNWTRAIA